MIKVCPTCQQTYPEDTEFCARDGARLEDMHDEASDPLIGRALEGRWVIEERIGEGGMGAVYLASQRSVDRKVAIKTLRPELCNNPEFVDRFFREARVASTIAHPHCVTIHDFGQTDDGTLYLAMEYLDGVPLTHRLRHPDLTVREILLICMQISSALAAAHHNNVIHRDLKPDNVFLLSISDGSVFSKVLDFGIAKVTDAEEKMTQTGQVFGTPEYMSPEQCRGDHLDGRSDLYSLGCILYHMIGGHPPFESDTPMAVLVSHVNDTPPDIHQITAREDIPERLLGLCMRLLAKDPDGRPADAQVTRAQFEDLLGHTSSGSKLAVGDSSAATSSTGETLAADSKQLADGGADQPRGADQRRSTPRAPGSSPSDVDATSPSTPQRTHPPDGVTTTPANRNTSTGSQPWKVVVGIGLATVVATGCAGGALFLAYNQWIAPDGEGITVAGLLGEHDSAAPTDARPTLDPAKNSPQRPSKTVPKAPEDVLADGSSVDTAAGLHSDTATSDAGGKAGGADQTGGAPDDDVGGRADDEPASAKSGPDHTAEGDDATPADTEPPHDGAPPSAPAAQAPSAAEDSSPGGTPEKPTSPRKRPPKPEPPKEPKPAPPPEPSGDIRRVKLSASGAACLQPDIKGVVGHAEPEFLSCYRSKLADRPDLSGKVMLAWSISTDGGIRRPDVLVSDLASVNRCLLDKLERLEFAPPTGGRCYVRAAFRFSP